VLVHGIQSGVVGGGFGHNGHPGIAFEDGPDSNPVYDIAISNNHAGGR
jgi:hypothetical protein